MQALKKILGHAAEHNAGYEHHALHVRVAQLNAEVEDLKAERDMYKNLYEETVLSLSGKTDAKEAVNTPRLSSCYR